MKLLHLYDDIMNLYGDYANVAALRRILENSGETVTVDKVSLGAWADLTDYDFVYIGSGTEENQKLVMEDLARYRGSLKAFIQNGKTALLTGNAFEMLGKSVTDSEGKVHEGLGLYDFTVTEQSKTRVTGDVIYGADFLDKPLVGFVNKCSEIQGIKDSLFTVKMGLGDFEGTKAEGIRDRNLFGTHLTGPALIKNPHLLAYIAQCVTGKQPETAYLEHERAGYEITLNELTKRTGES